MTWPSRGSGGRPARKDGHEAAVSPGSLAADLKRAPACRLRSNTRDRAGNVPPLNRMTPLAPQAAPFGASGHLTDGLGKLQLHSILEFVEAIR